MPYDRSAFVTRTALEDVSFDFMQSEDGFHADKLFTPKPIKTATKKVYQADTSKLRVIDTKKATNAFPNLVDEQLFATNLSMDEHKVGREVNPRDVADADVPQLVGESRAAKQCTQAILINRERLAAAAATTVGNYMTALTSAIGAGSRWNEAGGDPEADKVTADAALINTCGQKANAVLLDWATWMKIRLSPNFRDRTKYTHLGSVPDDVIKGFFDVDFVFIGKARYNAGMEGAADSISGFWGTNAIFFVYNPSVALEDMAFGLMTLREAPFVVTSEPIPLKRGMAGQMMLVQVSTEYGLMPGFVESSSSSKYAAGYLYRTVVA